MEWEDEAELAFDKLFMKHIRREELTSGKAKMLEMALMRAVEGHAKVRGSPRVSVSDVREVLSRVSSAMPSELCIESDLTGRVIPTDLILLFMLQSLKGEELRGGEVHLSHLL